MKDFFDIWILSRQFGFEGRELAKAIANTFENRGTEIEADPAGLSLEFATSDAVRLPWRAFLRKASLEFGPASLEEIRHPIREFLLPVAAAIARGDSFEFTWNPSGPWR